MSEDQATTSARTEDEARTLPGAGDERPPFTAEQLAWIDRMVDARATALAAASPVPRETPTTTPAPAPRGRTSPSLPIYTGTPGDPGTATAAAFVHGLAPTADLSPAVATTDTAPSAPPPEVSSLPGFAAVPHRLIKCIVAKEYIDMAEMLPDSWRVEAPTATSGCCSVAKRPRRGMVTDVLIWTECYATMASILSATFPDKAPHFTAHLRTVIRAARNFEGTAWATYDAVCRRQAANRGSLEWGIIDNTLYSEAFTGRARVIPRCIYCLADTHASHECACAPATPQAIPPTALDGRRPPSRAIYQTNPASRSIPVPEICRLYYSTGCRHFRCKYAHVCARCRMPHPAPDCEKFRGGHGPPRA